MAGLGIAAAQAAPRIQAPTRAPSPGPGGSSFSEVLDRSAVGPQATPGEKPGGSIEILAGRLDAGRRRLDAVIEQARSGKTFRPAELLALQAEVHQIGEEMALTHRLVEQGMAGIRKLWSMQV